MRWWVLVVVALLGGCPASRDAADAGPADTTEARAFLDAYRELACAGFSTNCPNASEYALESWEAATNLDDCLHDPGLDEEGYLESVAARTLSFDAAAAGACLAAIRAGACVEALGVIGHPRSSPCNRVFIWISGSSRVGESCTYPRERCAEGLVCGERGSSSLGCDAVRRCAATVPIGQPCGPHDDCESTRSDEGRCVDGVCRLVTHSVAALGEPCRSEGADEVTCVDDLVCSDGVCAGLRALGDVCTGGDYDWGRCPIGSLCMQAGGPSSPWVCAHVDAAEAAEPCAQVPPVSTDAEHFAPCAHPSRMICGPDFTCIPFTTVAAGEPCDFTHRCPDYVACTAGICDSPAPAGATCRGDSECLSGICGGDGVCADCAVAP